MATKGRCYKVKARMSGVRKSLPLHEVRPGTIVKALEDAPTGGLDVLTVLLPNGRQADVYSFQLHPIRCLKRQRRR